MSKFYFGVDYYPEQWPRERWETDAQLMREAGFNIVRLAEFAWVKLEPSQGQFDFAWLDDAIKILQAHGLEVVLGTPTASPPAWVYKKNPEIFRTLPNGQRLTFGHRRGYSPHHLEYQAHAQRIVTAMAEHYATHPAVIGWQIDNEFGDRDFGPQAQVAFQTWLEQKYLTLEVLNTAWGTIFWSHTYQDWSEIPVPLEFCAPHNPGLALDFARFSSRAYVAFQAQQLEVIRAHCPEHFVTHNFMGFTYDTLDYFDLAENLDFVSWDNYPRMWWNVRHQPGSAGVALAHATMRGLKQKNFWVMEQQSGPGGWEQIVPTPKPGEIRLWAYQAIAHGADGIVFFRFRTARHGTEQYWHGLLEHDGRCGRRYQEAKRIGAEIAELSAGIVGSNVNSSVAMLLSYDSRFALQAQQNNPALHYGEQFQHWYSALHRRNVATDVISPTADLSSYRLVIAPLLHVVTAEIASNLERFVRDGGTLLLTARCGVKDETNAIVDQPLPGLLRELVGAQVLEYESLIGDTNHLICDEPMLQTSINIWCDILETSTARVIARYRDDHFASGAAITINSFGNGHVIYVGALGDGSIPEGLMDWLLETANLPQTPTSSVEITERRSHDSIIRFYLNHTSQPQTVQLEHEGISQISGKKLGRILHLEAFGVEIISHPPTAIPTPDGNAPKYLIQS